MTAPTADRPIRVIQWTTGNIGKRSLHAIIGRSDMELVGVYAHGADKVGVDAAELAGWPEPTGVTATNDIEALIALKPDACCYNPLWPNIDELTRLLEAGVNVCSSAAWITGGKQTPEDLDRIRKACEKGDSTIFGSGAHPGMTNMVGMVLSGSCERVDEIRITESVDCSTYESAGTQTAMGFSQDPDTPGPRRKRAARKRGLRRVRGDDGRRDRREARPDDLRRHLHRRRPATAISVSCRSRRTPWAA